MLRGEGASTDLGTLRLVERWAADGRADEHGTQRRAAAVMAGAVCDPGCPGLAGTEVTGLKTGAAQDLALPRTPFVPSGPVPAVPSWDTFPICS